MSVKYNTYFVADARAWLYKGVQNGLSEQVISKVRAHAIVNNPYVKDDMLVVVSATDGDKVVGFTAMFPEHLVRPDVWLTVPTTLYAHPNYAGEFIGYYVSKVLHDTADGRLVIGTDLAKETILIDKLLGLKIDYVEEYNLKRERLSAPSYMPDVLKRVYLRRRYNEMRNNVLIMLGRNEYEIEYTPFVDDDTYAFITAHSKEDLFLRSQEMFNWMLQYGLRTEGPLDERVSQNNYFDTTQETYRTYGVKVVCDKKIVGFYILRNSTDDLAVKYLYFNPEYRTQVFASIAEHLIKFEPYMFVTHNKELAESISGNTMLYNELTTRKCAFSHPAELLFDSKKQLQGGDGDMFI